jgi:hypothetical protein
LPVDVGIEKHPAQHFFLLRVEAASLRAWRRARAAGVSIWEPRSFAAHAGRDDA